MTAAPLARISTADALRLYRGQSLFCRLYLAVRRLVLSLPEIESHLPPHGSVLDVGCGYGLLANYVALRSPSRAVRGIDVDPTRIATARAVSRLIPNVSFEVADVRSVGGKKLDAVLLIDMLHYFTPEIQADIVAACRRLLVPGGILLCRDVVREPGPRFWWNRLHEVVMVRAGITATNRGGLHFRSREQLWGTIAGSGFKILTVTPSHRLLPYTDTVFVARTSAREVSLDD